MNALLSMLEATNSFGNVAGTIQSMCYLIRIKKVSSKVCIPAKSASKLGELECRKACTPHYLKHNAKIWGPKIDYAAFLLRHKSLFQAVAMRHLLCSIVTRHLSCNN